MKIKHSGFVLFLVLALGICTQANAQKKPAASAGATKVTSVEGITEYRLSNGLRVLIFPDQSKPTATVNITYLVGSRMEGYGETGMAHLLEHMMFKGSTRHPHVPDELTTHGASPNGTTSYDRTNYFETFAATDENLNWALSLESDRMLNSFIADKDLKSEFSVVRNEFESGENSPSNILEERVLSTMYLWHNYGKATIGSKEDIEKVPIKNLQAFYRKYYQPDNAVLLVAGKIDEAKTLALVVKYFGSLPKPTRVIDPCYTIEPAQDGERSVVLNRVGDVQTVAVGYHVVSGADKDYPAFDVLNEALTNQPNGRLYQNMVKTGLATGVGADDPALKDPSYFYLTADVLKDKSIDDAKTALFKTIDEISTKPITSDEVDKAKTKILKSFDETYRNSMYIGLALSEYIAQGDWRLAFLYRDGLKKVTADDVNRIVKAYFIPSNRTWGEFIPTSNPVRIAPPTQPDVQALVGNYKGESALAQAEAFDPSPTNIEKRTHRGNLPGGAKYALLSKTTRGNTVNAAITLRIGDERSLNNKAVVASMTASMLKRGTSGHTMAQINETLDKLSSGVSISGGGQNVYITISSTRPNLAAALDLVTEMLRQPSFPADELTTLTNEQVSQLEQERSDPQGIAFRLFNQVMNTWPKGHINYTMSADEEIDGTKAVDLASVKSFYHDFYNGVHATAAVIGDFDEEMVKTKLGAMLGDWTSTIPYTRIHDKYDDIAAQDKEIKTPDKKNAMMVCGMNIKLRDDNPDYPALRMGNFIFGGGFLNSRLATRIRQKEGISYGVGSWLQPNSWDETGSFGSYAIYNPDNKAKLQTVWKEELQKMLTEGFTDKELKDAKSGYVQYRQTGRAEDNQLVYILNSELELGRTMAWDKNMDEKLEALKVSDINAAMKKYLNNDKITFVKAGDFK